MVNSAFERVIPERHGIRVEIEQEEDGRGIAEVVDLPGVSFAVRRAPVADLVLASTCQITRQVAV